MSTNAHRNLVVIGGMAVVIGGSAVTFAIRSQPAAAVAKAVLPPAAPPLAAPGPDMAASPPAPQAAARVADITPTRSLAAAVVAPAPSEPRVATLDPVPTPDSPDPVRSAAQITSEVQTTITGPQLGADVHIGVPTLAGVVVLTGFLPGQQDIDQVKAVAGRVQDVRSVDASAFTRG